jgi:hypothetical protein
MEWPHLEDCEFLRSWSCATRTVCTSRGSCPAAAAAKTTTRAASINLLIMMILLLSLVIEMSGGVPTALAKALSALAFFGLSNFPNVSLLGSAFQIRDLFGRDVSSVLFGVGNTELKPNEIRIYESGFSIESHDQKFSVSRQSYVHCFLVVHF